MSFPISGASPHAAVAAVQTPSRAGGPSSPARSDSSEPSFQNVLERLGHEVDTGEALVRRALRGGAGLDAGELIALQAGIYRYTEAVDLVSKVVDRAGSAVRTTLQSQG